MQLITFPKRYFSSNSIQGDQRYLRLSAAKRVKLIKIYPEKKIMTLFDFACFLAQNGRYLWFPWMDFDEWYLFGIAISCTFYDKDFATKFFEFRCQIWLQSWNLLKIGKVHKEFSNNSEVSSYLSGHILLFWKVTMPAFQ